MGAPAGNKNAVKNRPFTDALRRAIARAAEGEGSERRDALDKVADSLIKLAVAGKIDAIRELGDRLEGKPKQTIGVDGEDGTMAMPAVIFISPPQIVEK